MDEPRDFRSPPCARPGCIFRSDAIYFPSDGSGAYTLCSRHESDDYYIWLYGDKLSLDRDLAGWIHHFSTKGTSDWRALWEWLQSPDGQRWMQRGDGTVVTA